MFDFVIKKDLLFPDIGMIPLGKIRLTSPKLPFTRADFLNSLLASQKKKNSCSIYLLCRQLILLSYPLSVLYSATELRHQNDYENNRSWKLGEGAGDGQACFLEQLAGRSGAGFLNDWVENLAPNP